MNRSILILFSGLLIAVSFLGVSNPTNAIEWLFAVNPAMNIVRLTLAALFLAYVFLPAARNRPAILGMRFLGIGLVAASFVSIFWPGLYGVSAIEAMPLDWLLLLESGVIALLASLEPSWDPYYDSVPLTASDREPANKYRERRMPWQRRLIPQFFNNDLLRPKRPSSTPS